VWCSGRGTFPPPPLSSLFLLSVFSHFFASSSCHSPLYRYQANLLSISSQRLLLYHQEMWALFDFACEGKLLGSSRTFKQEYENPIVRVRTCLFYFAVRFLKQQFQAQKCAFNDEFLRFQSLFSCTSAVYCIILSI